jgi:hypothetical protein
VRWLLLLPDDTTGCLRTWCTAILILILILILTV